MRTLLSLFLGSLTLAAAAAAQGTTTRDATFLDGRTALDPALAGTHHYLIRDERAAVGWEVTRLALATTRDDRPVYALSVQRFERRRLGRNQHHQVEARTLALLDPSLGILQLDHTRTVTLHGASSTLHVSLERDEASYRFQRHERGHTTERLLADLPPTPPTSIIRAAPQVLAELDPDEVQALRLLDPLNAHQPTRLPLQHDGLVQIPLGQTTHPALQVRFALPDYPYIARSWFLHPDTHTLLMAAADGQPTLYGTTHDDLARLSFVQPPPATLPLDDLPVTLQDPQSD